jgi:DNA-binding transcriptional MerR regulator/DNA gyrase inhibitor GyrI
MNRSVAINKLSEEMGLTSRTLRHWESEGLFTSERDASSGWRVYDENALMRIRITAILRRLDIPLKDIQTVLANQSLSHLSLVVKKKISDLQLKKAEITRFQEQLEQVLHYLQTQEEDRMVRMDQLLTDTEDIYMHQTSGTSTLKIVNLPAMRMAYHIAVSSSPEEEAMAPVLEWTKAANVLGTARFFGGNMKPFPTEAGNPYGYGMCVSIPEGVTVPEHLKEMVLPGGLYAVLESSDDIPGSWSVLMKALKEDGFYKSDRSRLCLEEHIRNEKPEGSGNPFHLVLMEPVKAVR